MHLVITDPPYYDAIQYGELGSLFLAWARAITKQRLRWRVDLEAEAVPNGVRGTSAEKCAKLLRQIFQETVRTLAPGGRMLITYHSTNFQGWVNLGEALQAAGLRVVALAVALSENDQDHAKRGRHGFSKDLVLECARARGNGGGPVIVLGGRRDDERELIAAGRAIAVAAGKGPSAMAEMFLREIAEFRRPRIEVPSSILRNGA